MSQNEQEGVIKCREENAVTLQQYANNKRMADQFNDVTVIAGSERIAANRLVLACYSKFFESTFLSPTTERYQTEVEIQKYDGKIVRALIDFMYSGKINILIANAPQMIAVADFLQMDNVKQYCFEFLEENLTVQNCLKIVMFATDYNWPSALKTTYELIGDNFDQIVYTDNFKDLSKAALECLISEPISTKVPPSSLYNSILSWTQQKESRKVDFAKLFLRLDFKALSLSFLEEMVSKEPLVKENVDCVNAVMLSIFAKLKVDDSKQLKILCVNGINDFTVFEVYNSTGDISKVYPQVLTKPRQPRLVKQDDFVYCIGGQCTEEPVGKTNKVYQLNLSEPHLTWKEMPPMIVARKYFGAALYNGSLVVNGGDPNLKTTEVFDAELRRWTYIAATNKPRSYHALVAAERSLFAIGGWNSEIKRSISSVERLDDLNGQWREVQSMNTPKRLLPAVFCQGFIYAIGGYSTKAEKTVEKYDVGKNAWVYARSMNVERHTHAACVLQGKIFVVGGYNVAGEVEKTIECYDPELNQWTIVGETEHECVYHAMVEL